LAKTDRKKDFIELFEKKACNISSTCMAVGIVRKTFYRWCKEDMEFKEKIDSLKASLVDTAETMLYKAITDGNMTAIIFFLKTKGKDRGYTETIEHKLDENAGIDIVVRTGD